MKKIMMISYWICGWALFLAAQPGYTSADEAQEREMLRRITESSAQLKTLRCDFTQKKNISILAETMISEGALFFREKDRLRWEYTKPYPYQFVMNGDRVMILSGETKHVVELGSSKMFREISKMILSGINGSEIFDSSKFEARFSIGAADNMVTLLPLQKEVKQLFRTIRLRFDVEDYTVNSVEIEEISGDTTLIEMKNKTINTPLNEALFAIP